MIVCLQFYRNLWKMLRKVPIGTHQARLLGWMESLTHSKSSSFCDNLSSQTHILRAFCFFFCAAAFMFVHSLFQTVRSPQFFLLLLLGSFSCLPTLPLLLIPFQLYSLRLEPLSAPQSLRIRRRCVLHFFAFF